MQPFQESCPNARTREVGAFQPFAADLPPRTASTARTPLEPGLLMGCYHLPVDHRARHNQVIEAMKPGHPSSSNGDKLSPASRSEEAPEIHG